MAIKNNNDRRVLRSRSLLFKALLALMKEMDYKNIGVKDLTDKADIARPTFYRNYESIDDILIEEMDHRFDEYFRVIKVDVLAGNFLSASEKLFKIWKKNRVLFMAMQKANINHKILDRFDEYALRIKKIASGNKELSTKSLFAIHFFAGGAYMVLNNWLENNMETPTTELSELLKESFEFLAAQ